MKMLGTVKLNIKIFPLPEWLSVNALPDIDMYAVNYNVKR